MTEPVVEDIDLEGDPEPIGNGQVQLTLQGTYSDGSTRDVTAEATWTTADASIATVDENGAITAHAAGETTVTATLNGVEFSTPVRVSEELAAQAEASDGDAGAPADAG